MTSMTIGDALRDTTARLAVAGIDTPRLDAQMLLGWVLKCRREDLAREPECLLTDREALIFAKAVSLRAERRPLPYITGEQWFYGRAFKINRAVLIPRPETELLVTAALARTQTVADLRMADIGTGSGVLAVTLALERPEARVWATDLSADALTLARKNVIRHGVVDRFTLLQGDLLTPLPNDVLFDMIVSNPPYVREDELPDLQPEVRDYEPKLALSGEPGTAGTDGTGLHRRLLRDAPTHLTHGGWLLMEVGQGQAEIVADYARSLGWTSVTVQKDYAGIGRDVLAQWTQEETMAG
jgi:release factor glutamine methyltransferase